MNRVPQPVFRQAAPALIALFIGVGVYLLDRQPESAYFMAHWMILGDSAQPFFGDLGNHLPTFVHVYAFILLTAVVVAPSRAFAIAICIFWLVIDSVFELAQIRFIAQGVANLAPEWFRAIPFLENTSDYFLAGTFDVLDLYSIAAGSVAAYMTIIISARRTYIYASHIQNQQ